MKKLIFLLLLPWILSCNSGENRDSQTSSNLVNPSPDDVSSIDGIIKALYESISGDAGEPREWDRFRSLMIPEARLIPTSELEDEGNAYEVRTVEEFIEQADPFFMENGFYEYETHREVQSYGRIVHLMSTYASKNSMDDPEPFNSGINSIQLFNDGERWWIMTIYWAHASERNPIPPQFNNITVEANPDDVSSIDQIISALYESISGPKGQERQWDRFRSLFVKDARLIPSGRNQEGRVMHRIRGVEEYIGSANNFFLENGFFEREISREVQTFGTITHVFSTYESFREPDSETFSRGINSIQLLNDGERWWIVNIFWNGETEDNPIPERYLGRR